MMGCTGIILAGLAALAYSAWMGLGIMALPTGNDKMRAIALAIQEGASAFLSRQYKAIFVVGVVCSLFLWFGFANHWITLGFVAGALLSGISGYLGMFVSVRANVRTTQAAVDQGLKGAFLVAFRSGAVTGFLVNGLGLLGVVLLIVVMHTWVQADARTIMEALIGLGFGASLISIFARLGGGIFTKGADVGADLVGKIEQNIPEDDPRNPAVIADNVGDNVGDCAGMSADLFETYVVTLVACIQMAFFGGHPVAQGALSTSDQMGLVMVPLMIAGCCVLGCLAGTFFVRLKTSIMGALYKGLLASMGISAAIVTWCFYTMNALYPYTKMNILGCVYIGIATTGALVWITEYYTACRYNPVQSIAKASETGAGTNIIQGLAVSMESCLMPVLVIVGAMGGAYACAGLFGVSLAATAMLALMGMIIAIDAYGPVTDNAGGIAEMAGLSESVREITDQLDAVGNTTKAVTKGYAIGSAALAALVLFASYTQEVGHYLNLHDLAFDLKNPYVVMGLFVGGVVPYVFAAMSMKAVGHAASSVVIEVRRQFREIKGIMGYGIGSGPESLVGRPDYGRAVDILTKASIRAMIVPSLLPVILPLGVFGAVKLLSGSTINAVTMVGGALLGLIITGFFLAVSMTSGGGAWDNAKKHIEQGHHGGKGSLAYQAAVTGDTVGDPYKDTAGPAINPLIKIANLAALLLLAFL
jgi:K(+)-stimulated pyrophosphate-energized sodium pump